MSELEGCLQHAMVTYVGSARHDITPGFIIEALGAVVGIEPKWLSVHCYRPEDFLVVFPRPEHKNRVAARPSVEFNGVRLFFR